MGLEKRENADPSSQRNDRKREREPDVVVRYPGSQDLSVQSHRATQQDSIPQREGTGEVAQGFFRARRFESWHTWWVITAGPGNPVPLPTSSGTRDVRGTQTHTCRQNTHTEN